MDVPPCGAENAREAHHEEGAQGVRLLTWIYLDPVFRLDERKSPSGTFSPTPGNRGPGSSAGFPSTGPGPGLELDPPGLSSGLTARSAPPATPSRSPSERGRTESEVCGPVTHPTMAGAAPATEPISLPKANCQHMRVAYTGSVEVGPAAPPKSDLRGRRAGESIVEKATWRRWLRPWRRRRRTHPSGRRPASLRMPEMSGRAGRIARAVRRTPGRPRSCCPRCPRGSGRR